MKTNKWFHFAVLVSVALLLLAGCGSTEPTATEPLIAMDTTARTDTPEAADTPLPTDTPIPTEPPAPPTETLEPEPEALTWPTKRHWHTMAYDPQIDRVLLFCGLTGRTGGYYDPEEKRLNAGDEWAYDVVQNRLEILGTSPYAFSNVAVYDKQSGQLIGFGLEDTVVYDMETRAWQKLEPAEQPPTYRFGYALAYDSQSDRVIYNTNTWTQLEPTNHPSARRYHTMVYAEAVDKMVLFGGITGNWLREEVNDELWVFDPVAEEWSQVTPDSLNP